MDASHEHGAAACNGHVWYAIIAYDVAANDGLVASDAAAYDGLIAHDATYDATACHVATRHAIARLLAAYDVTACNAAACNTIANDADCHHASTTYGINSRATSTDDDPSTSSASIDGLPITNGVLITDYYCHLHLRP